MPQAALAALSTLLGNMYEILCVLGHTLRLQPSAFEGL
jgi:hypothetical protein